MALVKVKPTSAGPPRARQGRQPAPAQGAAVRRAHREPEARLRAATTTATSRSATRAAATSTTTASSTSAATRTASPAKVERLEYDPNRSAHLALLLLRRRRAPLHHRAARRGGRPRAHVGRRAPIKPGNALPLRNIPVGTTVHCVEMKPGKGAQIARSAGAGVQLLAREGIYAQLRLRSGEIRKVHVDCRADDRRGRQRRAQPALDRQGRREPLARHPADGARHRDEPGRPPDGRPRPTAAAAGTTRCRRGARRPRATRRAQQAHRRDDRAPPARDKR